jgi:hypothetical protein
MAANGLSAHLAVAVSIGSTLSQQRHLTSVNNGPRWVCRVSGAPKDREVWDIERKERRRAQRQPVRRSQPPRLMALLLGSPKLSQARKSAVASTRQARTNTLRTSCRSSGKLRGLVRPRCGP